MPDVFMSYSRRDSEFVGRLSRELEARERDVWVDVGGIEDAEVFPAAIRSAIEHSDSFVFIITPESAASQYRAQEVDYGAELHKRIIPVLRSSVDDDQLPADRRGGSR